jgi:Domain of unknown function (DUF1707)
VAYDPSLRASDDDRDRTAALLREHHAVGRLTPQEFSDRIDQTFAATTVGQLEDLLKDLPRMDLYRLPDAAMTRQPRPAQVVRRSPGRLSRGWRATWGIYATVNVLCFVIWMLADFGNYPWFLWVAGPWGIVMGGIYLSFGAGRDGRKRLDPGSDQGQLPGGPDSRGLR